MKASLIGTLCAVATTVAAAGFEGRWQGTVDVPGRPLAVVLDLARHEGAWTGAITLPGLGVRGAPLSSIAAGDERLAFDVAALDVGKHGPAKVSARLQGPEALAGEFAQAGHVATLRLQRAGDAQLDDAVGSTAVAEAFAHEWRGSFDLGGSPRHVTLSIANVPGAPAKATFVIVGKRTNDLPVDRVAQDGPFVRVQSQSTGVAFEGRLAGEREWRGAIALGGLELPLVLRRHEATR
jgi:hypothetical protein